MFIKHIFFLILIWYLFVNASEKSEWWITVYESETTIIKVKRSDYLEHQEFMNINSEYLDRIEKVEEYETWEYNLR